MGNHQERVEPEQRRFEIAIRRWEARISQLARRRILCWAGMGLIVLLVRASLLPLRPIPKPVVYDEFGYLLQADTFSSGRLTNPPHPLWPFFESIYILQQPTYNAKYPPGQGLILALGQRIFRHAWFGVWLSCGALMAALCWALQGWFPATWALLGSFLALPLCLFSYWMDSYWGGAVAGMGGAFVLGAYPRIVRRNRPLYAWLFGLGIVILANTRPYEGLLFIIPVVIALAIQRRSAKIWGPVAALLALGAVFILYYNYRVTGSPARLPQEEYQQQYGYAPLFNVLPLAPTTHYRHASMFNLSHGWEYEHWARSRSWYLPVDRLHGWYAVIKTLFGGVILLVPLLLLAPWTIRDSRMRIPAICVCSLVLGSFLQVVYYAHYAAPATAAIMILLVQSMRHLRQVQFKREPVGLALSRLAPAAALLVVLCVEGERIYRQETPEQTQAVNARRDKLEQRLRHQDDGQHIIIVRYTRHQSPHEEWVYNRADIDRADVIWAHDMGERENRKLMKFFSDRRIWLLEPDLNPEKLTQYNQ